MVIILSPVIGGEFNNVAHLFLLTKLLFFGNGAFLFNVSCVRTHFQENVSMYSGYKKDKVACDGLAKHK